MLFNSWIGFKENLKLVTEMLVAKLIDHIVVGGFSVVCEAAC